MAVTTALGGWRQFSNIFFCETQADGQKMLDICRVVHGKKIRVLPFEKMSANRDCSEEKMYEWYNNTPCNCPRVFDVIAKGWKKNKKLLCCLFFLTRNKLIANNFDEGDRANWGGYTSDTAPKDTKRWDVVSKQGIQFMTGGGYKGSGGGKKEYGGFSNGMNDMMTTEQVDDLRKQAASLDKARSEHAEEQKEMEAHL